MLGKAGVHRSDPSSNHWKVNQDGTSAYAVFSSVWHRQGSQLKRGVEGKKRKSEEREDVEGGREEREKMMMESKGGEEEKRGNEHNP